MKDKEYWKTVINGITPFEASMLVEAIYEDHDLRHEKEFRNYELVDIVSDLDTNDLAFLIKELAMREEIVDALKKAYETEWCISGKEVLKKLLEKRKQLLLQLNPINA